VQPASLAAARVIVSRSPSPMKRMRMQLALRYLGTPGTTVTIVWEFLEVSGLLGVSGSALAAAGAAAVAGAVPTATAGAAGSGLAGMGAAAGWAVSGAVWAVSRAGLAVSSAGCWVAGRDLPACRSVTGRESAAG